MKTDVNLLIKNIQNLCKNLSPLVQDGIEDNILNLKKFLIEKNYKAAFKLGKQLFKILNLDITLLKSIFHAALFAEDIATSDSVILIHDQSLYCKDLKEFLNSKKIGMKSFNLEEGIWAKDYLISLGEMLAVPAKPKINKDYILGFVEKNALYNDSLYYKKLNIFSHHVSKTYITSIPLWKNRTKNLFNYHSNKFVIQSMVEGGNLFCAINKLGDRFFLVGENVVSETMAYNSISREETIIIIATELGCDFKHLLIIPQWPYHLDLQMAYLGHSQFIIHSFLQDIALLNLDGEIQINIENTFNFLANSFEEPIINKIIHILEANHFEAQKIFGCLFYLDDCQNYQQLQYVPYCKKSSGFEGFIALLMNGIAVKDAKNNRYFCVSRCDEVAFKNQFVEKLTPLKIEMKEIDMLDCYDDIGEFDWLPGGVLGAKSVAQINAAQHGSLRCQTSIVSKNILSSGVTFFCQSKQDNEPSSANIPTNQIVPLF